MFFNAENGEISLTNDDRARLINLALFLELTDYNEAFLRFLLFFFNDNERRTIYKFWQNLTPASYKAYLCMIEFEESLYEKRKQQSGF